MELTDRELELIDGMIDVQRDHADRCNAIANRAMAEKQKGWDLERVELLEKIKASRATDPLLKEMAEALHKLLTKVAWYGYDSQIETEYDEGKTIMQKYHEQIGDINAK